MKTVLINEKDLLTLKNDARKMRKIYRRRRRIIKFAFNFIAYILLSVIMISFLMIFITQDRFYVGTLKPIYFYISYVVSMLIYLFLMFLDGKFRKKITTR